MPAPLSPPPRLAVLAPELSAVERLEADLLAGPQVACPVVNHFAPGIYGREMHAPAGALVIGHEHRHRHLCIVLAGRARVWTGASWSEIRAGDVFTAEAGTRKVGEVLEALRFLTIHANPTDETDPAALESAHVRHSETWEAHRIATAAERAADTEGAK